MTRALSTLLRDSVPISCSLLSEGYIVVFRSCDAFRRARPISALGLKTETSSEKGFLPPCRRQALSRGSRGAGVPVPGRVLLVWSPSTQNTISVHAKDHHETQSATHNSSYYPHPCCPHSAPA